MNLTRVAGVALILAISACSDFKQSDAKKAAAFLSGDPAASSTDAVTFSSLGYWQAECRRGNSEVWAVAVKACNEPGRHPPVCEVISKAGAVGGCP